MKVYGLSDPRTGEVRYVGVSSDPVMRRRKHIFTARHERTSGVARWIANLLAAGWTPSLLILEHCRDWVEAERRWIAHFRALGCALVNHSDGGPGAGQNLDAVTRAKFRAAKLGRAPWNKGRVTPVAVRRKQRASALARGSHAKSY